ncbi:hypothetical protein TNCT_25711 [Trichonephila clavata]|uniref:Uncharacterized protein n=1 Tax=Trichonephila clavata TaxID=2740835 RepID=A0A8X6HJ42_TRICU|nr:hypothetical protein TNCT_25711 [Trichonephila clavata]
MATPTQSQRPSVTYHVVSTTVLHHTLFYSSFILLLFRAFCRRFLPSFYLLSCCQRCVISLDQLISHLSTSRQENKALMWKKAAVDASGDSDFKERHLRMKYVEGIAIKHSS